MRNSILFALSNEDKIFHGGEEIQLEQIPVLIERSSKDRNKPVVIQLDRWADAALLARMIQESRKITHPFPLPLKTGMKKGYRFPSFEQAEINVSP